MNHKLVISRAVLSSALLLSAIAAPTLSSAASAGDNQTTVYDTKHQLATLTKASSVEAASVVYSFNNPVELAEQYAPETVRAWKKALEQYEKHVGTTASFKSSTLSVEALPAPAGEVATFNIKDGIQLTNIEEGTVALQSVNASGSATEVEPLELAKADSTPIKLEAVQLNEGVANMSFTVGEAVEVAGTTAAITAAGDADMSFIRAEIGLAKAVQADDAEEIKLALSKLLEQYEIQIAEWEAAVTK